MKNLWTRTEFCEMKVKKNSKKMDDNFTIEDFWKMIKIFALILFLTFMGFLNAEPEKLDKWITLDLPYPSNDMIVLKKLGNFPLTSENEIEDDWLVCPNHRPKNDTIIIFKAGRVQPK